MATVRIDWKHEIGKNVKKLTKDVENGLWAGCKEAVKIIGNMSEKEVPLDIGTLKDSWRTEKLDGEIGYKMGYYTAYAARLHEHPEYRFQNKRKAKYLEHPIEMNKGDWQGGFLDKLKNNVK